jgi:hypothetical protein
MFDSIAVGEKKVKLALHGSRIFRGVLKTPARQELTGQLAFPFTKGSLIRYNGSSGYFFANGFFGTIYAKHRIRILPFNNKQKGDGNGFKQSERHHSSDYYSLE